MIYVPTPSASVQLRIPRTIVAPHEGAVLTLRSTMELTETTVPLESVEASVLYFVISADFSAVNVPGEYEYRLEAGGALLASGVLVVGDLPAVGRVQYEKTQQYEQYNARQAAPELR